MFLKGKKPTVLTFPHGHLHQNQATAYVFIAHPPSGTKPKGGCQEKN
jgi:hypothetical protein